MLQPLFFILLSILWAAFVKQPIILADSHRLAEGRVGCPRCAEDGSENSRLLQKADALYSDFKPKEALRELLKIPDGDPAHHEALSKISRIYIDFGDMIPEPDGREKRLGQYRMAEQYARRAMKADPASTWGHFYVAVSLGKIATESSISKQIDLAQEIQTEVEKAIRLDPQNGYAYHIYGVWHRRVAEIGQAKRLLTSVFLRRSIPKGNMGKSVEYLTKAVSLNSTVIVHRLELAKTHMAVGNSELARSSLKAVQQLPIQLSDDPIHKKEAEQLLLEIKAR